jgi:hypothetical protein
VQSLPAMSLLRRMKNPISQRRKNFRVVAKVFLLCVLGKEGGRSERFFRETLWWITRSKLGFRQELAKSW